MGYSFIPFIGHSILVILFSLNTKRNCTWIKITFTKKDKGLDNERGTEVNFGFLYKEQSSVHVHPPL